MSGPGILTTGIGSLPHHNLDAALDFAFRLRLPFLPQIPMRNPWEFAIAQALEGLPGIRAEKEGTVSLDYPVWQQQKHVLKKSLEEVFSDGKALSAYSRFEPSASVSSSWQSFLWELEERELRRAKLQIVGPITSQWALRDLEGKSLTDDKELARQVFELVLARGTAVSRRLKSAGVDATLFLDEPALYAFPSEKPRGILAFQELKLTVQALKKEGVEVGLHCCSDADWEKVLGLGLDWVSLDVRLSLKSLLEEKEAVEKYVATGGAFAFGIIPTSGSALGVPFQVEEVMEWFSAKLEDTLSEKTLGAMKEKVMFTPACGLAFQTPEQSEHILTNLEACARAWERA